ncbi:class I SAM-dependent methyltransferase [Shouchella lehensis]|uniref:Methyltransferase n=1 Tax=Shouchella lehensis G1 TaxID=1246626 RepID=A0A060LXQ8_9BACI|nr:class I SAM-dependent methyltransferase [Shouchella lehensis]AIC93063.1 methyltransferase [Shouchella lehensis G1]
MDKLLEVVKSPEVFAEGSQDIWLDPDRADFVLQSHLDETMDGASKDAHFIQQSIDLISEIAPLTNYQSILDLGCGPGLYSEKLAEKGYSVTGIDFAENSIEYARKEAEKKNLSIDYHCGDFLTINYEEEFDLTLLIYQIFGILNPDERKKVLSNMYRALKPGGFVLLDVLSDKSFADFEESREWSLSSKNSMLSRKKHLGLISTEKYPNNVSLQKTVLVFEDGEIVNYHYWNQYFSVEDLRQEVEEAGFTLEQVYADVNGETYKADGEFIAAVLRK